MDGALPNGNAVSALNLLRLYDLNQRPQDRERAEKIFGIFSGLLSQFPQAFSQLLMAYDYYSDTSKELAVMENPQDAQVEQFFQEFRKGFFPNVVLARTRLPENFPGLLKGRDLIGGRSTFYLCQKQTCQAPSHDPKQILEGLAACKKYSLD
jgi:uncharacterized protein YyaL (SSP411 family)